jgi:hypothetical protein
LRAKYRLADSEIDALVEWIADGAPDPRRGDGHDTAPQRTIDIEAGKQFWAFQKPQQQALPSLKDESWPASDLDRFLLAGLEANGLAPALPASREVLLQRATFDLTGLPPTVQEIDGFKSDPANDRTAFSKVVDRLLASPQFGERWGRHWLDVVRYGESMGRTRNYPFPYAWKYRNYVIDVFNNDLSFDQFVTEQIAGDLLESTTDAERDRRKVATGFLALGSHDLNERNQQKFKMDRVDEQVDVTGRAFMALTTGCARCHDHKFDPIPTEGYYALAGIFASTDTRMGYAARQGGNKGNLFKPDRFVALTPVPDAPQSKAVEPEAIVPESTGELDRARKKLAQLKRDRKKALANTAKNAKKRGKQLQNQIRRQNQLIAKLEKNDNGRRKPLPIDLAMGVTEGESISDCKVNLRGDPSKLGDRVPRGFLQVVATAGTHTIPKDQSGRLELAEWLTGSDHPLSRQFCELLATESHHY